MATLPEAAKEAIVTRLARYEPPGEVAKAVGAEFGITIPPWQVTQYNPGVASFEGAQKWVYHYDAVRKAFREEVGQHAIADVGYRVGMLQQGAEAARRAGNFVLMASLLEQAAKDVGGVFTNRQMVHHTVDDRRTRPIEELREELAVRLRHQMEQLPALEGDIVSRTEERKAGN